MKNGKWLVGSAILVLVCGGFGGAVATANADSGDGWIKITAASKYVYTLDSEGNEGNFEYNTGNNAWNKSIVVDLGKNADGEAEAEQRYVLSRIQLANAVNVASLTVEVSTDAAAYVPALTTSDVSGEYKIIDFPQEVTAQYVKVTAEGAWATLWGAEYPFAFYGRAGELKPDTDPKGLAFSDIDEETVYTFVKGDNMQLDARFVNPFGEGEITYSVTAGQTAAEISSEGLFSVVAAGDGETEYSVTASVPKQDGSGNYTAKMKFIVSDTELTKIENRYFNPEKGAYDLMDVVGVRLVRAMGNNASFEYSLDGNTWIDGQINAESVPLAARWLKITGKNAAIYGDFSYQVRQIKNVASRDIDGFYPNSPLINIADGDLTTAAQTPNGNLKGTDILGSITVELTEYCSISAVRVYSFWNSVGNCYLSYSLDGQEFFGQTPVHFVYTEYQLGSDHSDYMDVAVPGESVDAKFVRLNVTALAAGQDFMALREITVYGTPCAPVNLFWFANTEEDGVSGIPQNASLDFGTVVERPAEPTLAGFVFKGWYTDASGENAFDFSKPIFSDVTLYAKWNAVHNVKFYAGGETIIADQNVEEGEKAKRPAAPERTGYIFKGWFTEADGGTEYDFASEVVSDLTLYAKWEEIPEPTMWTITVEITGKGSVNGAPASVEDGTEVTVALIPENGYKILSVKIDGEPAELGNGQISLTVRKNIVIEVVFEEKEPETSESTSSNEKISGSASLDSGITGGGSGAEVNSCSSCRSGISLSCFAIGAVLAAGLIFKKRNRL